jgi:hypothetical protein
MSRSLLTHRSAAPVRAPLTPARAPAYTSVIVIAAGSLPVHGRNTSAQTRPCLFPKIWDSEMNLVYERGITDPSVFSPTAPADERRDAIVKYVPEEALFRDTPSGMDADLERFVGANPLRIMARGVFGASPTDPVIDRADALLILSSEANTRLLREAKIVIVLDQNVLKSSF